MAENRRMLVAYMAHSTFTGAIYDYLLALRNLPDFDVDFVDVEKGAVLAVDLDSYDVVFNNFCARIVFEGYVSTDYLDQLARVKAVKVLAVQDEYDQTDRLKSMIQQCGFDIVLTCVPQDSLSYVYPREEFPGVIFETVFTGYVADDFAEKAAKIIPLSERPITIGYRGRDIGGRYGQMGFDKYEIGRRMKEICQMRGVSHDIAMDEDSRIYGDAWFEFIGSCRAMLGTESGSNVFDFDGSIARHFAEMTEQLGRKPSYEEFRPIIGERDEEIEMGQISPRVFECALMRTAMVLYRGRYSDALIPDEHYIVLEKDFSNIDEVLEKISDTDYLKSLTKRAYEHLVASGKFSYQTLLDKISMVIQAKIESRNHVPSDYTEAIDWRMADPTKIWERQPATTEPLPTYFYRFRKTWVNNDQYSGLLHQLTDAFRHEDSKNKRILNSFEEQLAKSDHPEDPLLISEVKRKYTKLDASEHIRDLGVLAEQHDQIYKEIQMRIQHESFTASDLKEFSDLSDRVLNDLVTWQTNWNEYARASSEALSVLGVKFPALFWKTYRENLTQLVKAFKIRRADNLMLLELIDASKNNEIKSLYSEDKRNYLCSTKYGQSVSVTLKHYDNLLDRYSTDEIGVIDPDEIVKSVSSHQIAWSEFDQASRELAKNAKIADESVSAMRFVKIKISAKRTAIKFARAARRLIARG